MKTGFKFRIIFLIILIIIMINISRNPIENPSKPNESSNSGIKPNGGGNPNTVAIFTAKVLQVGYVGDTSTTIYRTAIVMFAFIILVGLGYNGYSLFRYIDKRNKSKIRNIDEELPVEQDYSTSFNND